MRIALRAHKGAKIAIEKWQATADYLHKKIPNYRFILVPFENNSSLNQAMSLGTYHFCITNPASGIEHKIRYGSQPLATLVNKRQGKGYSKFGSVIFTRSDRKDINTLQDLKGKKFIAVDELGFGGWRVAWLELLKNDINPYTDFSALYFSGGKQQNVVYNVRDKKVAAGSVRTDMLERMAASGKINLSNFKVLGQKEVENFPFLLSSQLYPEWMFSSVKNIDNKLQTNVMEALYSIQKNSIAAKKGGYIGWIRPLDYKPVENLLKELKVGPYNIATMGAYKRIISQYGVTVVITILIFIALCLIILYILSLNKKILHAKESLQKESDISKKLEAQLLHSQRIKSLSNLTGGIAHDFNNQLSSILGYTELALDVNKVKEDKTLTRYLQQVVESSTKSAELVTQMLTFSRAEAEAEVGNDSRTDLPVTLIFNNLKKSLQPIIPDNIHLNIKEASQNLFVNSNETILAQALMNLYLNAKDSIENRSGNITFDAKLINFNNANKICSSCHQNIRGEYVEISICDDGCGINADVIETLFEPFFTTKDVGKGTGMGLSMTHGIIHSHKGHMLIESKVNMGTTVKILLPTAKTKNMLKAESKNIEASFDNNKHILLVDNETSLTIYLTDFLNLKGFKVTAFNDSQKALLFMQKNINTIDLVIIDQVMPNMSGLELAKKITELNESMPLILCSGYSEGLDEKVNSELNNAKYIPKPIKTDKLLKIIANLLN